MSNAYVIRIIDYEAPLVTIGTTTSNKEIYIAAATRGTCTAWLKEKGYKKCFKDKNYWFHNSGQDKVAFIMKAKAIQ